MLKLALALMCFYSVQSIDITNDVFGKSYEYLPAAFGDFDSDKLTDIFVIQKLANESYIIEILLSQDSPPYIAPSKISCTFKNRVRSIVPSDFDGDGAMDLMVLVQIEAVYHVHILWGSLTSLECLEKEKPIISLASQPLLMDYNGDMIADLFGEDIHGNRSFWLFSHERTKPTQIVMTNPNEDDLVKLRKSSAHAFVDLNDDLAADLWVDTDKHFEVWLSSQNYASNKIIEHPLYNQEKFNVIGQSAFLDIDLDGTMEVILPVCADDSCFKSFLYVYDFSNTSQDQKWSDLKVNLKDDNGVTWTFPHNNPLFLYTNTITARVGDVNLDGYPDILMTMFNDKKPQVILLINSECKGCNYSRTFIPQWKTFESWPYSVLGTFFDFEEDGNLDVLLVNASSDGKKYTMAAYRDASEYDAMFVKVLVLTGQCYQNCEHKKIPYGTNQPGPSVTYSITNSTGSEQKSCATQLTQSSHFALQLPFTILGLGRNWNFVDKLNIGLPLRKTNISHVVEGVLEAHFTQIIPNSQLKVIPYPIGEPDLWITKLFITPSKAMLLTAGSLIATCMFVAAIIAVLHYREKQEDKRERRQESQKFHFDAM